MHYSLVYSTKLFLWLCTETTEQFIEKVHGFVACFRLWGCLLLWTTWTFTLSAREERKALYVHPFGDDYNCNI